MGLRDDAKALAEGQRAARSATPEWGCARYKANPQDSPARRDRLGPVAAKRIHRIRQLGPRPAEPTARPRGGSPNMPVDLRRFDAVLFDLDGVITDTAAVHAAAWKQLFDDFLRARSAATSDPFVEFDLAADYREYVDGKPRYEGVRSFLGLRYDRRADPAPQGRRCPGRRRLFQQEHTDDSRGRGPHGSLRTKV